MIKKIALITLFVLFAGILIYGAVNRTRARSELATHSQTENLAANGRQSLGEQSSYAQGRGQGQGQGNQGQDQEQGLGQGNQGQGQGNQGQGNQGQGQGNQGQGSQGQGQGAGGQGQGQGQGRVWQEIPEQVTIAGTVIQAPEIGIDMIVETDDVQVLVGTGPGYLAEQGFVIAMGDQVRVQGFWENEEFKAVTITLAADGQSIILRDEWGRPMWSGAGRNAQNRQNDRNDL